MRIMLSCVLFVTNVSLFSMQHDDEQPCDSTAIVIPVAVQPQPVSLALQPGCCAICYEPIDDSIVHQALACRSEHESKIKCSTCTAIYHRSCLENFFSLSSSVEARNHQCPSRCGTELIPLPCSQRLARWCRKNVLMFDILLSGSVVAVSLVSKYSTPAMYACLGLSIIFLIAYLRGLVSLTAEIWNASDIHHYGVLASEAKKVLGVECIGFMVIAGALVFRYLVLD